VRSDIICLKCGTRGHKQYWCPNINQRRPQKIAEMQVINRNSFYDDRSMCSDGKVQLACGCMLPVVAGAFSYEGERMLKCIGTGNQGC